IAEPVAPHRDGREREAGLAERAVAHRRGMYTGRVADRLMVFMKGDCPTCQLVRPIVEAAPAVVVVNEDSGEDALRQSHAHGVDTVPTVLLPDGTRLVGFDRERWREVFKGVDVDWSDFPAFRPGCGSRSVEPGVAERLAAGTLRARRIEI